MIEAIREENDPEQEGSEEEEDFTTPAISFNALTGASTTNTMRLLGRVRGHQVTVLIDLGSSHNFINARLVSKLKLGVETTKGIMVQVANGEKLKCEGRCKGIELELPGYKTATDCFVLQLEEIDITLGIQWLKTLGSIVWNFESLTMSFQEKGETVELQGQLGSPIQLCDRKQLTHSLKKRKQGLLMYLQVIEGRGLQQHKSSLSGLQKDRLNKLLRVFQAIGVDSPLVTKCRSRRCVGIRASHRSLLPGSVILDVSSLGATYVVELKEAFELNNLEVRLANLEKAEERSVLSLLAFEVAGSEKEIKYLMEKVLELDMASARGFHSHWINSVCPYLFEASDENELGNRSELHYIVDFNEIQHPLPLGSSLHKDLSVSVVRRIESSADAGKIDVSATSLRSANRQSQFPVPLDITIQQGKKIVIISGPNIDGKTATMKTLGVAVLMSKAGSFLPCTGCPRLPWFDQVLADIGGHQSLEHSLSTFSGPILRLCGILEFASPEIGSGTDPSEGLALSTSILHYIVDRAKLAVVTTHYTDLSYLKLKEHRFENAAMDFSLETLQPTYRVLWGSTGSSNALDIAKLVSLDRKVLDRAHEWVEKLIPDKQEDHQGVLYQSLLKEKQLLEDQAKKTIAVYSDIKKTL